MDTKESNYLKAALILITGFVYFGFIKTELPEYDLRSLSLVFFSVLGYVLPILGIVFGLTWVNRKDRKNINWTKCWNISIIVLVVALFVDYYATHKI